MSPSRTLYVRDEDVPLWDEAEKAAKTTSRSVSTLVADALRSHLKGIPNELDPQFERIVLLNGTVQQGFVGRWLTEEQGTDEDGYDAGARWVVAQTKGGKFAVHVAHVNEAWEPGLTFVDDLDGLDDSAILPADVADQVRAEVQGSSFVRWLDV